MRWLNSITDSMNMNLNKRWGTVEDRGAWYDVVHGGQKVRNFCQTEQLNNNTGTFGLPDS